MWKGLLPCCLLQIEFIEVKGNNRISPESREEHNKVLLMLCVYCRIQRTVNSV